MSLTMKHGQHPRTMWVAMVAAVAAGIVVSCGFSIADKQIRGDAEPVADTVALPAMRQGEDIVRHTGYTASYNHTTLCPDWVAWVLTADEVLGQCNGQYSFSWDPDVQRPKAMREDYSNSGWDKGHMAPRADMKWSERALEESYYFTNICPQHHEMNSQAWRKIEELTRRTARRHGSVAVVCGPLYDGEERHIGPGCVQVPDRFFKALAVNTGRGWQTVGFIVANDRQTGAPRSYTVTVDSVEAAIAGSRHGWPADLFPTLPDSVEATINWNTWQ